MKLRIAPLLYVLLGLCIGTLTFAQNYSLYFRGEATQSDWVTLPQSVITPSNTFTVEAWCKLQLQTGIGFIFVQTFGGDILLYFENGIFHGVIKQSNGLFYDVVSTSNRYRPNQWQHVAFCWNRVNGTLHLYVDGVLAGTTIIPNLELFPGVNAGSYIGRNYPTQNFLLGHISCIRISYSEVYTADFSPTDQFVVDENTAALWNFSEGSGTILHDVSINNRTGTIIGAQWTTDVPKMIRVVHPNGGEVLRNSVLDTIRWNSIYVSENVKIEVNRNYPSGSWTMLFDSVANFGYQPWLVSGHTSTTARIRILSIDDPNIFDISDSNFTIQFPDPAPPGNLTIATLGENANLTWARVDTNIYGQAITVERYLVFFRADESYGWNFLASTMGANSTQYTHATVVTHSPRMFYQVRAWIGDTDAFDRIMRELPVGTPEQEVLRRLGGQVSQPVVMKAE